MTDTTPYLITIEMDESGLQKVALPTPAELAEKSEAALQAAMGTIKNIGERVRETIKSIPQPPTKASVEFGLKLGAEAGVIAKGAAEAHFVVTLEWERSNAQ